MILVTGGLGFVGSHFARMAREQGRDIVVLDDGSGSCNVTPQHAIPLVLGDIGDTLLVRRICSEHRVTAVVHFAGKIQVGESVLAPELYFDVNIVRTLSLLAAIRDAGVEVCLFSSTAAVYGEPASVPISEAAALQPVNPYGATKLAIEHALEAWGTAYRLRWCALRYFNAAGAHPSGLLRENHEPETHLIPLVLDAALGVRAPLRIFGDDYATPDGTCVRDYIHVQDLAAAHLIALAHLERGETLRAINLGTGAGFSVKQIIDTARDVMGRDVPHSIAARRAGDPPQLVADPTRASSVLHWTPQRSNLRTIVEDTLRSRRGAHP